MTVAYVLPAVLALGVDLRGARPEHAPGVRRREGTPRPRGPLTHTLECNGLRDAYDALADEHAIIRDLLAARPAL